MPRPSRKAQPKYGFFNLPSDEALGYPRFSSFEQREVYIRNKIPKQIMDIFNQIVAADHENQATQSLEEILDETEESYDMEHSQRFLDDTKRFKALMEAANSRYQDEQEHGIIQPDRPLPQEPQEQTRKTSNGLCQEVVSVIDRDLDIIDNSVKLEGYQVPVTLMPTVDPLNHNSPSRGSSTSSKEHELKKTQVQDKSGSSSSRLSTLKDRSPAGTSRLKRKNKYLEHNEDEITFQQLPLKSLIHPKKKLKISSSPIMELRDHIKLLETMFVGETTSQFVPLRGDLIVVHPDRGKELMSKGYLASYEGPDTHKFEHGELVVRIGYYEQVEQRKYLHQPYKNLELYAYNREGDWRYLGRESEVILDTQIPTADSLGKVLQGGSKVGLSCEFKSFIPRRGDVIIRRPAWIENFAHRENFRYSMVKWHKERPVQWEPDDMVIRLFVDKEMDANTQPFVYSKPVPPPDPGSHSDCIPHGPCQEEHTPPSPGFAELYRIEGLESRDMDWVFWGRTKHLYDTPYLKRDPLYLHLYSCEEDKGSHLEVELHSSQATK